MLKHLSAGFKFEVMPFFNQYPPQDWKTQTGPALFCKCDDRPYHLAKTGALQMAGMPAPVPKVVAGTSSDPTRNFRWLPFVAGRITYVPLRQDVIFTGIMTGCWLFTFILNAETCLGHIGTDNMSAENTQGVKDAWRNAEKAGTIRTLKAFKPTDLCQGSVKVFGAISADQTCYGIATTADAVRYRVDQLVSSPGVASPVF